MTDLGFAGKIARAFINSKLTPLIVAASLLLGLYAVLVTPREEEPQIVVPMADVLGHYPGRSPNEVEEQVTRPLDSISMSWLRCSLPMCEMTASAFFPAAWR